MCLPEQQCALCHVDVVAHEAEDKAICHQVFDLPPITLQVTQYLRLRGVCSGCGHKHHAALPAGLPSGQLGSRGLVLVGTLLGQFHLAQGLGLKFSIGTFSMEHGDVAQALACRGEFGDYAARQGRGLRDQWG